VLFGVSAGEHAGHAIGGGATRYAALAVAVHTAGSLAMTALVAFVIYETVGRGALKRERVNMDLVWAAALVLTGVLTLAI